MRADVARVHGYLCLECNTPYYSHDDAKRCCDSEGEPISTELFRCPFCKELYTDYWDAFRCHYKNQAVGY